MNRNDSLLLFTQREILITFEMSMLQPYRTFFTEENLSNIGYHFHESDAKNPIHMPKNLMTTDEALKTLEEYDNGRETVYEGELLPYYKPTDPNSIIPTSDTPITTELIQSVTQPSLVSLPNPIETSEYPLPEYHSFFKYRCEWCNKMFYSLNELNNHISRNHVSTDKFSCRIKKCDKTYTTSASLNLHIMRIHTKKTYKCRKCDKKYSLKGDCDLHMKRVHKLLNH